MIDYEDMERDQTYVCRCPGAGCNTAEELSDYMDRAFEELQQMGERPSDIMRRLVQVLVRDRKIFGPDLSYVLFGVEDPDMFVIQPEHSSAYVESQKKKKKS